MRLPGSREGSMKMKNKINNKRKKIYALLLSGLLLSVSLAGCGSDAQGASAGGADDSGTIVLKGIAAAVPHAELIEAVEPQLEAQGIKVDLVSTAPDATTNQKLAAGEIDFNFFQHEPYLESENKANGFDLVSAGATHVEPITAYSDKYKSVDELPDNAVVAIPSDGTNEYRALLILEKNGFIKLKDSTSDLLDATVDDVEEYLKPIKIVEIDADQIIPTKADYDFYITNTNKVLEAKVTSNKLFSEGADSPYANIVAVRAEDKDDPAIKALVAALTSDEAKQFIEEHYNGAVIPV